MTDVIDQAQEFDAMHREADLAEARRRFRETVRPGPERTHCRLCGDPIPEPRRRAVPGTDLCADCQADREKGR